MFKKCPDCQKNNIFPGKFCHHCGAAFPEDPVDTTKGENKMYKRSFWVLFLAFVLMSIACFFLYQSVHQTGKVGNSNTALTTQSTSTTQPTAIVNNQPQAVTPTHEGLDYPSKSWFFAKAGTVISGDVAIFENDNNSQKIPIYDSKEKTADIVFLAKDDYIWAEWGCYAIENANSQDVANLVNQKIEQQYTVRFFNGYDKLGSKTPTVISSKIDATSITLAVPAIPAATPTTPNPTPTANTTTPNDTSKK